MSLDKTLSNIEQTSNELRQSMKEIGPLVVESLTDIHKALESWKIYLILGPLCGSLILLCVFLIALTAERIFRIVKGTVELEEELENLNTRLKALEHVAELRKESVIRRRNLIGAGYRSVSTTNADEPATPLYEEDGRMTRQPLPPPLLTTAPPPGVWQRPRVESKS